MIVGMAGETTSCSIAVTIIATRSAAVTRRRPARADPLLVSSVIVASSFLSLVAGGMSGAAPGFPGDRAGGMHHCTVLAKSDTVRWIQARRRGEVSQNADRRRIVIGVPRGSRRGLRE